MKNQYNSIFIFCTFRGQLLLFLAFISINLFNVVNYAYTEGCGNLLGESVGLAIKLQEDPTFVPEQGSLSPAAKAYQLYHYYKEKTALEGQPLPKNPMLLSTPEPQHSLPSVETPHNKESVSLLPLKSVPQKIEASIIAPEKVQPLFVYNSNYIEKGIFKQIITDINSSDLDAINKRKLIHIMKEIQKLELKYKTASVAQYQAMLTDVHKIFINPRFANASHYVNLHHLEEPSNASFLKFNDVFQKAYYVSNGNPILLEALAVYNKNTVIYNQLLDGIPINFDRELITYNKFRTQFGTLYKEYLEIVAEGNKHRY
jgi:hypothetical protein